MARAIRTFNIPDCTCGHDHDLLEFLVASVIKGVEEGDIEAEDALEIGYIVAQAAEQVGWVKAGDELEDLRMLTNGLTGMAELEPELSSGESFTAPQSNHPDDPRLIRQHMLLSVSNDELAIARPGTDSLRVSESTPEVVFVIALDRDLKLALIRDLTASLEEDDEE